MANEEVSDGSYQRRRSSSTSMVSEQASRHNWPFPPDSSWTFLGASRLSGRLTLNPQPEGPQGPLLRSLTVLTAIRHQSPAPESQSSSTSSGSPIDRPLLTKFRRMSPVMLQRLQVDIADPFTRSRSTGRLPEAHKDFHEARSSRLTEPRRRRRSNLNYRPDSLEGSARQNDILDTFIPFPLESQIVVRRVMKDSYSGQFHIRTHWGEVQYAPMLKGSVLDETTTGRDLDDESPPSMANLKGMELYEETGELSGAGRGGRWRPQPADGDQLHKSVNWRAPSQRRPKAPSTASNSYPYSSMSSISTSTEDSQTSTGDPAHSFPHKLFGTPIASSDYSQAALSISPSIHGQLDILYYG
ncbi:hypothetical protein RvY_12389 [Ramazzottius varieornatus]|uniref:Uncharacterized protein n=1 Tax=Ramazzottius varieornatus TaxID=947166 RepID=A0A1D1VT42_RAMVA|nr:hypothetical protein RvY_12389 [Ramazzottius varieornatus]